MGHDHSRVHSPTEQDLVLIVHRHHNEEFCTPAVEKRSKAELGAHEIVGVAGCGGVAYLGHFFDVVHTPWNDVGGDFDVKDKISVPKLDMPDRPAVHELFPSHGVTGGHSGGGHRGSKILGRGVIRLVREWRGHLILVVGVEVSLRVTGVKGAIGLCLPAVVVVVVVGMVGGGRWRIIWNTKTC